jgi:hypothetical protein
VDANEFATRYRSARASGCWRWRGALNANGCGKLKVGDRTLYAHRFAYELLVAPLAPGEEVIQSCGHRDCGNPLHLVAQTPDRRTNC